jgi:DNA-binding CsgD family transcriptional regulator
MWASSIEPVLPQYEFLKQFTTDNATRLTRRQKEKIKLTEITLLRQLNRHGEADELTAKHAKAFNSIDDSLYILRWKLAQLIESYRTGSKQREQDDQLLEDLIKQAGSSGWIVEHMRALFLRFIVEKLDGKFKQALQTAHEVNLLATRYDDKLFILRSAWAVPDIYFYFGQRDIALQECLKVKCLFSTNYSLPSSVQFYVLLGDCHAHAGQLNEARKIFEDLLAYLDKSGEPDNITRIALLSNIAYVIQKEEPGRSEQLLLQANTLAIKEKIPFFQLTLAISLAQLYAEDKLPDKMLPFIQQAEELSQRLKVALYEVQVLDLKVKYAKLSGDTTLAFTYLEQYTERYKEWQKLDNSEKLKAIETKHQLEVQQLNQEIMKKELEHKDQEMQLLNSYLGQKDKLINEFASYFTELEETNIRRKEIFQRLRTMVRTIKNTQEQDESHYLVKFNEHHRRATAALVERFPEVSAKEADTAVMLMQGLSNKEIASLTLTTTRNIEKHRLNLRKKLQLSRSGDLVREIRKVIEG